MASMKKSFYEIFSELNKIPRPSHHEERVADYLCKFAEEYGLKYKRDAQNCVVIQKPATPGYEDADTVVILNHMDMVCVSDPNYKRNGKPFNALEDEIIPYVEVDEQGNRWMKAEGTSLGADNGMGLSMALAILSDDDIIHPALEVLTTTNEEDGMSGAEALSKDFIKGRKVINLDSEAYDEITVGAAGACLQVGKWNLEYADIPNDYSTFCITIDGGLGGHSGVDINKGRCNTNKTIAKVIHDIQDVLLIELNGGTANASIASKSQAIIAIPSLRADALKEYIRTTDTELNKQFATVGENIHLHLETVNVAQDKYISNGAELINGLLSLPYGVQAMCIDMPDTVMTSNNIGVINHVGNQLTISCHTRSFGAEEQQALSTTCREVMLCNGAYEVEKIMDTGAWMENTDSPLLSLTCQTFNDILGFEPKKVAMHFVLEAAYYVEKYPGIEIASIGPLIIEPHSTSERVNLTTADNIWKVTIELLHRLAMK